MAKLVPELYCTDFECTLRFYVELLGFKVIYARPQERFAFLDREGAQIMIEQPTTRTWLAGELARPFGRGVNFEIDADDADELQARCKAAGSTIFLALEEKWYLRGDVQLGCRQFIVQDPDGYLLRFSKSIGSKPVCPMSGETADDSNL
jgi:catechol 2,3-dioxygenase-like lactoylglutathione lyase family enzyme